MRGFQVVILQIVVCIVYYNMSIGTAVAKVVDANTTEASRPASRPCGNVNLPLSELDLWVDIRQAMGRCHPATFEAVNGLDHANDATATL